MGSETGKTLTYWKYPMRETADPAGDTLVYRADKLAYQAGSYRNYSYNQKRSPNRVPAKTGKRGKGSGRGFFSGKKKIVFTIIFVVIILAAVFIQAGQNKAIYAEKPELDVELLTVNPYSRPGTALQQVNGIVVHYTANQGSSAIANRNYFENLKDTHSTKASAHFIIGLEGEIVQCIPTAEIAYASNSRNSDTISIECCYENDDGSFNTATYRSLVQLTAWLCVKFNITSDDVIRHYDVTGKLCPKYYVRHPDKWQDFKSDVATAYSRTDQNG
ncbi:MAG: N-acetylmuramoyl-L-alanine amidase family protein [Anaerovoracaceae bacterium]|jgi:N-acetylmuramoyl-L-alanine amidase